MRSLYSVCIISVLTVGYTQVKAFPTEMQRGQKRTGKIYNGKVANAYPWTASIKQGKIHSCGASIISNKFLLSAAHCFDTLVNRSQVIIELSTSPLLSRWSVTLGEFNVNQTEKYEVIRPIERLIFNGNYDSRSCINDIVLIELKDEIPWTNYIKPISLPQVDIQKHDTATAAGWGLELFTEFLTHPDDNNKLRAVELKIYDNDKCSQIYQERNLTVRLDKTQMCAGTKVPNVVHDTSDGDSGGPLFVNLEGQDVVVGITSKGIRESVHPKAPAIYTRVFAYLDWINSKIHSTTLLPEIADNRV